jgi:hypothetical protein
MATRKCMTCRKDFQEGDPEIHNTLEYFDELCICNNCVRVYRKEVVPEKVAD